MPSLRPKFFLAVKTLKQADCNENPTWNAQSLELRMTSLADPREPSGGVFWEGTKRLANWNDNHI